jgi:hypothetical protein
VVESTSTIFLGLSCQFTGCPVSLSPAAIVGDDALEADK